MLDSTNCPCNPYLNKIIRIRKRGKSEYDIFIVNRNSKNSFKRFLSGFEDQLKWFKCKHNDIVELSKTKVNHYGDIQFYVSIRLKIKNI